MALADIVKQGRLHSLTVARPGRREGSCDVDGVALVGRILEEEEVSEPVVGEVTSYLQLLGGAERARSHMSQEPSDEMRQIGERSGHPLLRCDLQSMQYREVGRNSIRSAPMALPHFSHIP